MVLVLWSPETCRLVGFVRKFNDNGVIRSLASGAGPARLF